MNNNQLLDRRIQRTRALLQEAFFHLIIQHGYEHITIADITEQANVGRTTFYLHYHDKEDLLQKSIEVLLHELHLEVELTVEKQCTYHEVSVHIFQHVAQRQQLYQAMLKEAGPTRMLEDLMKTYFIELGQRFLPVEQLNIGGPLLISNEMLAIHAAGSLLSLLTWWLNHDATPSAQDMGTIYCQLMSRGTGGLLS